jgi:alpha-glucosidase
MAELNAPSIYSSMNQLSNHDHSRFLTRTNHKVGRVSELGSRAAEEDVNPAVLKQAVVMLMTWPGAPTLYYGDEAGVCGFTDPDNRRTYPWGREDRRILDFHRDMTLIHKNSDTLKLGSLMFLECHQNLVSYARIYKDEVVVVVVGTSGRDQEEKIPVWKAGVMDDTKMKLVMMTNYRGHSIMPKHKDVQDGHIVVHLAKDEACVFKWKREM